MRRIDKNSPEYEFVRQLIDKITCVVCSGEYSETDISILGQQEEVWMLMVSCPHCATQAIIVAVIKEHEQVEILTELTPEELERAGDIPTISTDDVLDIYRFLQDFNGDFRELFKEDLGGV